FLVFTLLYTPCVAAVATIRRELGSRIKTVGVVLMQCSVAWLASYIAFAIGGLLA
ncbi:MAG: ferrous iron transport protein B, partial [Oscillospiraceae bacterium]|nr:ferrous iron transport protein B [Oscillospiraceae bacterium]